MSRPNEPRFEDDFFNEPSDDDPYEQETPTIESIAITKAWNYSLEYDPTTGMTSPRAFSAELKEAYKAGFLEGFTYRLTEPTPDTGE
jgi:hypothetical protein